MTLRDQILFSLSDAGALTTKELLELVEGAEPSVRTTLSKLKSSGRIVESLGKWHGVDLPPSPSRAAAIERAEREITGAPDVACAAIPRPGAVTGRQASENLPRVDSGARFSLFVGEVELVVEGPPLHVVSFLGRIAEVLDASVESV